MTNYKLPQLVFISLILSAPELFAQSYGTCSPTSTKKLLDDFCPKLEGQTLQRCCPVKSVSITCNFYKPQTFKTVNYSTGGCPAVRCCNQGTDVCASESTSVNQTAKVNFLDGTCCSAPCLPLGPEWTQGTATACSDVSDQVCAPGTPSCGDLTGCPVTPATPSTPTTPSSPTTPTGPSAPASPPTPSGCC